MAITVSKTSDVVRVVHVDDPDVAAHNDSALGWVPFEDADVITGATCLGVRALSKRELMLADGDMTAGGLNAGVASYHLAVAGLKEIAHWNGDKLTWAPATRANAEEFVESVQDSGAIWQLGGLVRKLSQGWTPGAEADVAPLDASPAVVGQTTDG